MFWFCLSVRLVYAFVVCSASGCVCFYFCSVSGSVVGGPKLVQIQTLLLLTLENLVEPPLDLQLIRKYCLGMLRETGVMWVGSMAFQSSVQILYEDSTRDL